MSVDSTTPFAADIITLRENYDTSNPVIANIIKAKEERLKLLQEFNKQQEQEFGSLELDFPSTVKRKKKENVNKQRKSVPEIPPTSLRRSLRIQNSPNVGYKEEDNYKPEIKKSPIVRPPNDYGHMPGVEVGFHWETRMECSMYGVHRPTVAGIHGGPDGAYSIALSGGYPEDVDDGDSFIYTGAGGRDLKGTANNPKNLRLAPQTKDQQLEGTNLSLVKSIKSKLPIRVIRGYKSPSIFAPETGYRYDGLYQVVSYWEDVGKTGFRIYRFKMERMKDQDPPPWEQKSKPYKKQNRNPQESVENELVDTENDSREFKENIKPFDMENCNPSEKEVKDVDNEIQTCISILFKRTSAEHDNFLTPNCGDEDFIGWDAV